jgi:hypothetical protein
MAPGAGGAGGGSCCCCILGTLRGGYHLVGVQPADSFKKGHVPERGFLNLSTVVAAPCHSDATRSMTSRVALLLALVCCLGSWVSASVQADKEFENFVAHNNIELRATKFQSNCIDLWGTNFDETVLKGRWYATMPPSHRGWVDNRALRTSSKRRGVGWCSFRQAGAARVAG